VEAPEVPEAPAALSAVVWARLQAEIEAEKRPGINLWPGRRWAAAAVMSALLVVGFVAGRFWPADEKHKTTVSGERILMVAVAGHLERSEMFLLELSNATGNGHVDLGAEVLRAGELVGQNRLYRQAASAAGQDDLTSFLDDLERLLVDLSHSPTEVSSSDLEEIRGRLAEMGLLFKVRVVVDRLQQEAGAGPARSASRREI
jgi:hypothetical protein